MSSDSTQYSLELGILGPTGERLFSSSFLVGLMYGPRVGDLHDDTPPPEHVVENIRRVMGHLVSAARDIGKLSIAGSNFSIQVYELSDDRKPKLVYKSRPTVLHHVDTTLNVDVIVERFLHMNRYI